LFPTISRAIALSFFIPYPRLKRRFFEIKKGEAFCNLLVCRYNTELPAGDSWWVVAIQLTKVRASPFFFYSSSLSASKLAPVLRNKTKGAIGTLLLIGSERGN
jgi:hypothetical protein